MSNTSATYTVVSCIVILPLFWAYSHSFSAEGYELSNGWCNKLIFNLGPSELGFKRIFIFLVALASWIDENFKSVGPTNAMLSVEDGLLNSRAIVHRFKLYNLWSIPGIHVYYVSHQVLLAVWLRRFGIGCYQWQSSESWPTHPVLPPVGDMSHHRY